MGKFTYRIAAAGCVMGVAIATLLGGSPSKPVTIPGLLCPVGTCNVGGFRFGDDWTFGQCPPGARPPKWKKHTGVDIRASAGTTVVAAEAGTVKYIYSAGTGWANAILIEHVSGNSKYVTQYMHVNRKPGIAPGIVVKRGQPIATVAAISTPHLHFGVWNGPFGSTAAHRGALPSCASPTTACNDGSVTDPCFPQLWVNPMTFF
jgi:murein DD-endopeptidase MepM/ murein hydrolase activator NlpD